MKDRLIKHFIVLLYMLFGLSGSATQAQGLRLAVAANAQFVIKAIQADFKKKTGIETEAIIGSSGNLAAQIRNGAPFDVFLSADMEFPNKLFKEGFGVSETREYALGSLVVCTIVNEDVKNWRGLLTKASTVKIAIANPAVAPYGKAAEEALRHYSLWEKLQPKLVYGESISQVNTYITTGTVNFGFTTEALIFEYPEKNKLKWERIDPSVYEKIRQGFIILDYARKKNLSKARQFSDYLLSPAAKKIFKRYGYLTS